MDHKSTPVSRPGTLSPCQIIARRTNVSKTSLGPHTSNSSGVCLPVLGQTSNTSPTPPAGPQTEAAPPQHKPPEDQKPAESTTTPPQPAPSVWSVGPVEFSGLVDGYYSYNSNHPVSRQNQLRNFDFNANQFSLNMAKLSLSHSPDPIGFQVDFGFGRAFDVIHASEQAPQIFQYLEQVYVSVKPAQAKGFEVDFGEFVTSAGAEVIETNNDWNYSRSLLFSWAIPYYHFGLRTSMPLTKSFTAGFQVVNGWNNIEDNNSGKTIAVTGVYTKPKFTWSNTLLRWAGEDGYKQGCSQPLRHHSVADADG